VQLAPVPRLLLLLLNAAAVAECYVSMSRQDLCLPSLAESWLLLVPNLLLPCIILWLVSKTTCAVLCCAVLSRLG
jgi:hypothetical protein